VAAQPSPIARLTDQADFRVEGRPLVRSGDAIEALPPYRIEVRAGRILAAEELRVSAARAAETSFLMPGLADPHLHLVAMASRRLQRACLPQPPYSRQDLIDSIAETARLESGCWVRLEGFEEADLREGTLPTLAELDAACPNRPLRVRHASRHASLLNSAARRWLKNAGWSPAFGQEALLVGREIELARLLPRADTQRLREALREEGEALLRVGITCIDEVTASNDLERLELLASAELPQHIRFWLGVDGSGGAIALVWRGGSACATGWLPPGNPRSRARCDGGHSRGARNSSRAKVGGAARSGQNGACIALSTGSRRGSGGIGDGGRDTARISCRTGSQVPSPAGAASVAMALSRVLSPRGGCPGRFQQRCAGRASRFSCRIGSGVRPGLGSLGRFWQNGAGEPGVGLCRPLPDASLDPRRECRGSMVRAGRGGGFSRSCRRPEAR